MSRGKQKKRKFLANPQAGSRKGRQAANYSIDVWLERLMKFRCSARRDYQFKSCLTKNTDTQNNVKMNEKIIRQWIYLFRVREKVEKCANPGWPKTRAPVLCNPLLAKVDSRYCWPWLEFSNCVEKCRVCCEKMPEKVSESVEKW